MDGECTSLPDFLDTSGEASPDDIFSILEALEGFSGDFPAMTPLDESTGPGQLTSQKSTCSSEVEMLSPKTKRQKVCVAEEGCENSDGQVKVSHITVERNRRKQMNEHLTVLRSLMPCFYVKRGDQASIIGGVVDYITELQQVLQSLEAKKQRKVYSEVLSPRVMISSPRTTTLSLSPRKPPLSPRPSLPISPRTPQSASPYRPPIPIPHSYLSSSMANNNPPSSSSNSNSSTSDSINDLVANSKSAIADVEVKFAGSNLVLKTVSSRLQGQVTKIISVLEDLSLEILQASINTVDDTIVYSFTIKIGIECRLSADDLAQHVQRTFS